MLKKVELSHDEVKRIIAECPRVLAELGKVCEPIFVRFHVFKGDTVEAHVYGFVPETDPEK